MDWDQLAKNARDFVEGMAASGYRRRLRGQALELNDLFLLLCYMDLLGLPNPAALYLFDVYPYVLDELHLWHRRLGMDRSPLADFSCC